MTPQVAITGLAILSPFGACHNHFWQGVVENPNIITSRNFVNPWSSESVLFSAGFVDDNLVHAVLGTKQLRSLSRETRFAISTAMLALQNAGWSPAPDRAGELGVIMGTLYAGHQDFSEASALMLHSKPMLVNPAQAPEAGYNAPASRISIRADAQGLNLTLAAGLSSSIEAIRLGTVELINRRARAILAGGVDVISAAMASAWGRQMQGVKAAPFDRSRRGTHVSEAAACVLMERIEDANERGAQIIASVKAADVGFCPMRGPARIDHAERVLRRTIAAADLETSQIDAVFASASGDLEVDFAEAFVLHRIFGSVTPICGIKGATGELFGASGAVLAIAGSIALYKKVVPPTHGFVDQDPNLPPLNITRGPAPLGLNHVLLSSLDSEGYSGAMVLSARAANGRQ